MDLSNPDNTQVLARRRFAVPPSRIWAAFTQPEDMSRWMWGGFTENCEAHSDLRVGGSYSVYTDSNATSDGWHTDRVGRLGVYVDIVPEKRLVYTLHWDAPVGYNQKGGAVCDEVFVVTLTADGPGTLVEVRHLGIPDDGVSAGGHRLGLGEELEMLASLVETP